MPGDTEFTANSFGIEDTKVVGNYEAAEEFLSSGEEDTVTGDPTKIKKIEEEAEGKKTVKKVPTKQETKTEGEEEEETTEEEEVDPLDEIEDDEEDKKTKKAKDSKEEGEDEEEKEEGEKEAEDQNVYANLHKDLLKLGVFTQQDGEKDIKDGNELLTRFQLEGQLRATQWLDDFIGRHGDDRKQLFEAIFINGVDPEEYIPVYNEVQKLEGLDLTVEDNQKKVYREYYRRLGWDADKLEKKLQKTMDYGDLQDEVPDLYEQILAQDKDRLQEMEDERKTQAALQQRMDQEYKTGVQKILTEALKTKQIKGIPITDKRAREAFDFIYTPKYKTPNGQLLTEFDKFILESKKPENLEQRLMIALFKLNGFDFKDIKKQGVSEESSEIFNSLATKVTKDKTRATKTTAKASSSSWSNI